MDNASGSWLEKSSSKDNIEDPCFNIIKTTNGNLINCGNNMVGFNPYNESSSSSTTQISENNCISKSVSLGENFQSRLCDDDEWTSTLETCFARTLDGDFKCHHPNCPQEASSKDSLEEQLNNYFSRTFGNYTPHSGFKPQSLTKREGLLEYVNNPTKTKTMGENNFHPRGSSSFSSDTKVIYNNSLQKKSILTSSNVSTDCGVCEFIPLTNTSPSSSSQFSDKFKNRINAESSKFNGSNNPKESITQPISTKSNDSIKGTYCSRSSSFVNSNSFSNSSDYSFGSNLLTTHLSSSLLGELYPSNDIPHTYSELGNETYRESSFDSISFFNKDVFGNGNDSYYKTLNSKDMELIFNNMDSMSRVDNLLIKDVSDFNVQSKDLGLDLISDYNSESVSGDLLNNDALFSEIYRDNDTDDSEVWDNMMKKLCITSNLNKYCPKLLGELSQESSSSSKDSIPADKDDKETSDIGIILKNKDNMPSILPSDPNLGFKKTSLCKYWQRGICANDDCNFAHGKKELRSTIGVWRTTICHHWKTGVCRVGKDCRHAHGEEELQPKNIPANVLKNKLLNSARKYEYMRKKKNTY